MDNAYPDKIFAIVSRGDRPDLAAAESLRNVKAAVLLIVGTKDSKEVIGFNKNAFKNLKNSRTKEWVMIKNAGHLFEEEGTIEQLADVSTR